MAASVRLSRHPLPREQPRQPRAPLQRDERVGAAYQRALSGDRGTARPTAEVEVRTSSASQNVKPSPEVLKAPPSESRFAADSLNSARPADRYSAHRCALHCIAEGNMPYLSPHAMTSAPRACADTDYPGAPGYPRGTRRPRLGVRIVNPYGCTHSLAGGMTGMRWTIRLRRYGVSDGVCGGKGVSVRRRLCMLHVACCNIG